MNTMTIYNSFLKNCSTICAGVRTNTYINFSRNYLLISNKHFVKRVQIGFIDTRFLVISWLSITFYKDYVIRAKKYIAKTTRV